MTDLASADKGMHRCLITGGNGYLGRHISAHLSNKYDIITLGRGEDNTYRNDLSLEVPVFDQNFEVVVHCAGKAHSFPRTTREKQAFFDVNVKGTKNLLEALENASFHPKSFVFISSVSVYGATEGLDINEETPLFSSYAYGASKIEAEKLILAWCKKHQITCLILRLPLLAGKNPPGNLKMMIKGIKSGYYFNIAGGYARKSVVMAEDVAQIIPKALNIGGVYNLTDGYHPSFGELADLIAKQLHIRRPKTIPKWIALTLSFIANKLGFISPINAYKFAKLNANLTFDDTKARKNLGWKPNKVLENFQIK